MNDAVNIIEYEKIDLSDSLLLVAFPTVGMVGYIAGHYIVTTLKMEEIGAIVSKRFIPATIIHNSRPSPPVRIYQTNKICGPEGSCKKLAIIISEFMLPEDLITPVVEKIFNWAQQRHCQMIVTLEGTHTFGKKEAKELQVFGVASTPGMVNVLKKYNIEQTQEGMITGVTGVLLADGNLMNRNVICLLSEANSAFPDARAAGNLIHKLEGMLPGIKIDPEPLYQQAENIEQEVKKFLEQSRPTGPVQPYTGGGMYE
jgi:uncharacterized protein